MLENMPVMGEREKSPYMYNQTRNPECQYTKAYFKGIKIAVENNHHEY